MRPQTDKLIQIHVCYNVLNSFFNLISDFFFQLLTVAHKNTVVNTNYTSLI